MRDCQRAKKPAGSGCAHHAGKSGTRGFKKSSPNCKLKVYLGKRDFVDHLDKVDLVDGMVLAYL